MLLTNYLYLEIDQVRVRYVDSETIGRPAVLLIHGLGGSIESWEENLQEISKELRVIALDLPGFGLSDKPKINYTIRYYMDFIFKFIKRLRIWPITLLGSSLGGHVAAEVAINSPDLVSRLILISPAGALPSSFKGTAALRNYVRVLKAKSVLDVKNAISSPDARPVDDSYAQLLFERLSMPGYKEAFRSALRGSARAKRLTRRLHKIKVPILLLWGKGDNMIPVKFIEPFVKIKSCRIMLLENCGHRPHSDRPLLFNKIVIDFVKE